MARAVALPTATASVRIFFIRSSGANFCPFLMPMLAGQAAKLRVDELERLVLDHVVEFLVELEVLAWTVLNGTFEPLMNSIFGGLAALLSG